jgi:hypothetical protein
MINNLNSKKLIVFLLMEGLAFAALLAGKVSGDAWLIFAGALALVYLFVQGQIDVNKVKIDAGPVRINPIDEPAAGGKL